jgi:hypothetical protein
VLDTRQSFTQSSALFCAVDRGSSLCRWQPPRWIDWAIIKVRTGVHAVSAGIISEVEIGVFVQTTSAVATALIEAAALDAGYVHGAGGVVCAM